MKSQAKKAREAGKSVLRNLAEIEKRIPGVGPHVKQLGRVVRDRAGLGRKEEGK